MFVVSILFLLKVMVWLVRFMVLCIELLVVCLSNYRVLFLKGMFLVLSMWVRCLIICFGGMFFRENCR